MKLNTLTIVVVVALILVGTFAGWVGGRWSAEQSGTMRETSPEAEPLRWIQHADVIADFRQHVEAEHDMRFVTRYGLSFETEYFGLKETPEIQQLVQKYGSRRLEASDDIVTSAEQMQLQGEIGEYGARYNNMLLGYLECHK